MESQIPHLTSYCVAIVCGFILGLEREANNKPAGMRSHILVCLGATIFTVMSTYMSKSEGGFVNGDPTRIAAQIVSGIGFLGAGAILKDRYSVVGGLTTATTIWVTAALGVVCGSGLLVEALFLSCLVTSLLIVGRRLNKFIHSRQVTRDWILSIQPKDLGQADLPRFDEQVREVLKQQGCTLHKHLSYDPQLLQLLVTTGRRTGDGDQGTIREQMRKSVPGGNEAKIEFYDYSRAYS